VLTLSCDCCCCCCCCCCCIGVGGGAFRGAGAGGALDGGANGPKVCAANAFRLANVEAPIGMVGSGERTLSGGSGDIIRSCGGSGEPILPGSGDCTLFGSGEATLPYCKSGDIARSSAEVALDSVGDVDLVMLVFEARVLNDNIFSCGGACGFSILAAGVAVLGGGFLISLLLAACFLAIGDDCC
jgi:hypothetical protein